MAAPAARHILRKMHSEFNDPKPLPGERPVPSIKVDALKLLDLLLRAEMMATAIDRKRYILRAEDAILDIIGYFQIAHDFEDERLKYLKLMWASIAKFMDLMRIIGERNVIRVNLTRQLDKEGRPRDVMTPDQMKIELFNYVASLDEGATKWKNSIYRNKGKTRTSM